MIGRLVLSADFQRLLAVPAHARSAHFAVHHLPTGPGKTGGSDIHLSSTELSTDLGPPGSVPVDSSPGGHWLGLVVPKRHARRSVTRNLLRRQIRAVMAERLAELPPGLWLVRLRAPFDRALFVSAASKPLRQAAHNELQQVFRRALRPAPAARQRTSGHAPA